MTALAFLCAIGTFFAFGLAADGHGVARLGRKPHAGTKRRLRRVAWLLLAMAMAFAVAGRGWTFGPVVWMGATMFAAALAFMALNFLPASIRLGR